MYMLKLSVPTRKDYKEIIALINEADKVFFDIYTSSEAREVGVGTFIEDDLTEGEKSRKFLILKSVNKIVGFASFRLKNTQTVWVSSLYVLIDTQRKGYGTVLLQGIEKFALKNRAQSIVLETEKKAKWAVNFYLKNGYKKLSIRNLAKFPFDKVVDKKPVSNRYVIGKVVG